MGRTIGRESRGGGVLAALEQDIYTSRNFMIMLHAEHPVPL